MKTLSHFGQLDGLRFLAAFLVMLQHWLIPVIGAPMPLGFIGVTGFFVLSGFLISRILIVRKQENLDQG